MQRLPSLSYHDPVRAMREIGEMSRSLPPAALNRFDLLLATSAAPEEGLRYFTRLREQHPSFFQRLTLSTAGLRYLIAVFTHSGFTARLVSRYRPMVPIVAFTPEAETRRRMALIWGVIARGIADVKKVDGLAEIAEQRLLEEKLVKKGDVIGVVAGTPMGIRGTTNFMKFHVVG